VDDAGGYVALCQFVNVAPLCCDRVNCTIASVVCLGRRCVRVGGVEVLDRMEGQREGRTGRVSCSWVFRMASNIGLGKMFWLSFKWLSTVFISPVSHQNPPCILSHMGLMFLVSSILI
jgi:hypothetical protein